MIKFKSDVIKYTKHRKTVYIILGVAALVLLIIFIAMQLLKYEVEGEQSLPFKFKNMLIVSTADAVGKENSENRWDLSILQNNDIYIEIEGIRDNDKIDSFNKVTLENFNISNGPQLGKPEIYKPVNDKDLIYLYKDENIVMDKIEYNATVSENVKKLEIGRNGGIISFSSCSNNIANYVSNEDTEVKYDGSLLNKVKIKEEQIKYDISFDIIVEMESKKMYKATMNLSLPLNNLIKEGIVQKEITNFDDVVFKRV